MKWTHLLLLGISAVGGSATAETPPVGAPAPEPASAVVRKVDVGPAPIETPALVCDGAVWLTCGAGTTGTVEAPGGAASAYACVGLSYEGAAEAVYAICLGGSADRRVQVDMLYTHDSETNDLDLFFLGSCDENDCLDGDFGTSGYEHVEATLPPGTYWVVVDAWDGRADGSPHTITITCDSPCPPSPVDAAGWGEIKARYRD